MKRYRIAVANRNTNILLQSSSSNSNLNGNRKSTSTSVTRNTQQSQSIAMEIFESYIYSVLSSLNLIDRATSEVPSTAATATSSTKSKRERDSHHSNSKGSSIPNTSHTSVKYSRQQVNNSKVSQNSSVSSVGISKSYSQKLDLSVKSDLSSVISWISDYAITFIYAIFQPQNSHSSSMNESKSTARVNSEEVAYLGGVDKETCITSMTLSPESVSALDQDAKLKEVDDIGSEGTDNDVSDDELLSVLSKSNGHNLGTSVSTSTSKLSSDINEMKKTSSKDEGEWIIASRAVMSNVTTIDTNNSANCLESSLMYTTTHSPVASSVPSSKASPVSSKQSISKNSCVTKTALAIQGHSPVNSVAQKNQTSQKSLVSVGSIPPLKQSVLITPQKQSKDKSISLNSPSNSVSSQSTWNKISTLNSGVSTNVSLPSKVPTAPLSKPNPLKKDLPARNSVAVSNNTKSPSTSSFKSFSSSPKSLPPPVYNSSTENDFPPLTISSANSSLPAFPNGISDVLDDDEANMNDLTQLISSSASNLDQELDTFYSAIHSIHHPDTMLSTSSPQLIHPSHLNHIQPVTFNHQYQQRTHSIYDLPAPPGISTRFVPNISVPSSFPQESDNFPNFLDSTYKPVGSFQVNPFHFPETSGSSVVTNAFPSYDIDANNGGIVDVTSLTSHVDPVSPVNALSQNYLNYSQSGNNSLTSHTNDDVFDKFAADNDSYNDDISNLNSLQDISFSSFIFGLSPDAPTFVPSIYQNSNSQSFNVESRVSSQDKDVSLMSSSLTGFRSLSFHCTYHWSNSNMSFQVYIQSSTGAVYKLQHFSVYVWKAVISVSSIQQNFRYKYILEDSEMKYWAENDYRDSYPLMNTTFIGEYKDSLNEEHLTYCADFENQLRMSMNRMVYYDYSSVNSSIDSN